MQSLSLCLPGFAHGTAVPVPGFGMLLFRQPGRVLARSSRVGCNAKLYVTSRHGSSLSYIPASTKQERRLTGTPLVKTYKQHLVFKRCGTYNTAVDRFRRFAIWHFLLFAVSCHSTSEL